ncbi:MAG: aldo/keto reductase [Nitrospirae bacterium]|nr:aldo/keto reductase [Candidatus Manganitrophaceae bacterium]
MRQVTLPSGLKVPALGQGTWGMGESRSRRSEEVAALRFGLDLGLTLIDTAEMYGEGGAERVVAEAMEGRRDAVYLVTKVYPHHANLRGTLAACERSLQRLRTDRIDLYLLHWRSIYPLSETVEAFEALVRSGKIRNWGVSNFDLSDLKALEALPEGRQVAANQVLYNLTHREVELDLIPWCRERHLPIMAYSPIEQGRMLGEPALKKIAARRGITPAQAALAWLLEKEETMVIPKASHFEHLLKNRAALEVRLGSDDLTELDRAFPAPRKFSPLRSAS